MRKQTIIKNKSHFNSGWLYVLVVLALVVLGLYFKLKGSEWQVIVTSILLQGAILLALWNLFLKRFFTRKKR